MSHPHEESPGESRRSRTSGASGSRERILVVASELFSELGYLGTSTRDITDRVGIKQPSLYVHFPSKRAILDELLRLSMEGRIETVQMLARSELPADVAMYYFVWSGNRAMIESKYDLSGVHIDYPLRGETIAGWGAQAAEIRRFSRSLIRRGTEEGYFVDIDPTLVQESITGINLNTIRLARSGDAERRRETPRFVADFVLRSLLVDAAGLPRVREAALGVEIGLTTRS